MKKTVKVEEVEGEGLLALLDEVVMLWCGVYIYKGKLTGVNDTCVLLEDAKVVYETGKPNGPVKLAEDMPGNLYVRTQAIECFYKAP